MCTNTDDADDEYLDDPISLVAIEDIKTEICVDEDTVDQVIDISSDEEETCTSAYGKKTFVLPVTFFDVSKNVRLLNKCKPMSIRVIDCKRYPTHYAKYQEKCRDSSDECSVEADSKCKSDKETNLSNVTVEDTVITSTKEKTDKKQEGEQKRRIHSYDKLKLRKEKRKHNALKCKDLSQVDFKRNVGLVGLKITDTIFKQIVESEKALISKCNSVENHKKSEITSITTKTVAPNSICKYDSVAEKALTMKKSVTIEENSKGNNKKYPSEPEKLLLSTTKTNTSEDKLRENIARVPECLFIKKITCTGNKYSDKKESDKDKANIERKSDHTDKNKCKEKKNCIAAKDSIKTKIKSVDLKCKEKMPTDVERTLIGSICKSTTATVAIIEQSKKQEFENNTYMKKLGAVLDNLGTSVIPLTGTTNDYVPKHVSPQDNSEVNSIKASISPTENLDSNNEGSQIRCSLKILGDNVIKKVLKLKKAKSGPKNVAKTVLQQNPKELHSKAEQIATNINFNQSKQNIEGVYVPSDKDKIQIKRTSSKELEKHSDGTKQVEKALVKVASSDQAGPNSPVIPCTTISARAATPKLAESKSTPVQKQSAFPNVSTTNKTDVTISKCTAVSKHNEPVMPNATIKSNCDTKGTFLCNQNTTFSRKTVTEFKYPKSRTLAAPCGVQNNVPAMIEPSLSHHNLSKMNPTKEPDLENAHIKPALSAGNLTNGMVNNQANPNQQTNTPLISRTPSKFSGHNAIIFRKSISTPSSSQQLLNYPPPHQTVVNRFQYQPIPPGPRPMRFNHPQWRLPPPPPPTPPSNANLTQVTPQRFISPRVPPTHLRGMEMGLHHWRFHNPPFSPINRPALSVPRPPRPQVNEDSLIGNTTNGDPIKKINVPVVPNIVADKQKMLAELNNAMLSPELTNNQDNDLKRKADKIPINSVTTKHSKPGPLSKKIKLTTDEYEVNFPDKLSPNNGYSPPILPIFPYQESFKIFSPYDNEKAAPINDGKNRTPLKRTKSSVRKLDKDKRLSQHESGNQDKAKKISFADYRKRVVDRRGLGKIRKYNDAKDVTDDYNQDQGYDSDSTVKL